MSSSANLNLICAKRRSDSSLRRLRDCAIRSRRCGPRNFYSPKLREVHQQNMEYVNLGRTGLKVSRLSLGCMTYGTPKWRPWGLAGGARGASFRRGGGAGINFFDTADMYSDGVSEEVLGRALRELAIPRQQVVVATKVFNPMGPGANQRGLSSKHIRHAIDASLRRLQLDYVDLYQIHRFDPTTS